ncbi:MAG: universal stress protein [Planctomycetes bacterium]|nr:universal stress protein [Planctomycetota bacterium]
MLGKVLIGFDGSEAATRTVDWCIDAFEGTKTELLIVASAIMRPELGSAANQSLAAEVQAGCDRMRDHATDRGLASRSLVLTGDPRSTILACAEREGVDLIVIGSRGHSELTDLVLGSVASYLTHHSPRPVLVIR